MAALYIVQSLYKALTAKPSSEEIAQIDLAEGGDLPMFLYNAYVWKDDPRNESSFCFRIQAPTEAEAMALGHSIMAKYFPEYVIDYPYLETRESGVDVYGSEYKHLPFLSTTMTEAQITKSITSYRKRRFYIPPAARAYGN
ncbi:hypothetical protein ACFP81_06185 [Deinococcus lacus]|uniref:Uncharacterized protein n=1 Tax=Deinococcus lacus TaxID=392561 RepID=A0ABW1YBM0_9DEIO